MPHVRDSFFTGGVSSSAVQVLADARREHPAEFAAGEKAQVDAAISKPRGHLQAGGGASPGSERVGADNRRTTSRSGGDPPRSTQAQRLFHPDPEGPGGGRARPGRKRDRKS